MFSTGRRCGTNTGFTGSGKKNSRMMASSTRDCGMMCSDLGARPVTVRKRARSYISMMLAPSLPKPPRLRPVPGKTSKNKNLIPVPDGENSQ